MSKTSTQQRAKARAAARRRKRLRSFALPGVLALAIIGGIAFAVLTHEPGPPAKAEPPPIRGNPQAPVVLAAYEDFQCSACGAFARGVMPQLIERYVEPGQVQIEWHDYAWYGPESRWAANAARCAGDQGKFWEYHDHLYDNQAGTNQGAFAKNRLKEFGRVLGLDSARFDACVDTDEHAGAISADMERVRELNLRGTPSFFVNGTPVPASPQQIFAAIEAALRA